MKKILFIAFSSLLLLTAVACGQKNEPSQMANPWTDHDTLAQACTAVGFDLALPNHIEGYNVPLYRTLNNNLIEVIFSAENNEICIRKAVGGEAGSDISGDYNDYTEHTALHNDKISGILDGVDGMGYRANWQSGKYSYSLTAANGLEIGTIYGLIDAIH